MSRPDRVYGEVGNRNWLRRLFDVYVSAQFAKFLLAGGVAALVNFLSRFAYEHGLGYGRAVVAAYLTGFVIAFVLNRAFVFPGSGKPMHQEIAWFMAFNLVAFFVVLAASLLLFRLLDPFLGPRPLAEAVSHAAAILIPVAFTFVAHRQVTFARRL